MSTQDRPAREAMEFDVVIVGAGPAGLASAIRLKQINADINVVVVEKGSEVGAHILSGAVIDPVGLDKLLPEWRNEDTPIKTAVTDDRFYYLGAERRGAAAQLHDAAADEQPRQLHRLARQRLPLAGGKGGSARRRNLSGLCRGGSALRRQRRGGGHCHRRHGHRQERRAQRLVHRRHGAARQVHAVRGRRARQSRQAAYCQICAWRTTASRRSSASGSKNSGRSRPTSTARDWCSTRSAGRSTARPAAARSSTTSTTIWCRSASWCISTTPTRISRRSRNSSASRPIRWCATPSPAANGSLTARARSPKAAISRCPSSRFPAAR